MKNVFNSEFVQVVRSYLRTRCKGGRRVTREEVSAYLAKKGHDVTPEFVGLAVSLGAFNSGEQAWDKFAGRYGGIRELDLAQIARMTAEQEKHRLRGLKAAETRAARKNAAAATAPTVAATA